MQQAAQGWAGWSRWCTLHAPAEGAVGATQMMWVCAAVQEKACCCPATAGAPAPVFHAGGVFSLRLQGPSGFLGFGTPNGSRVPL